MTKTQKFVTTNPQQQIGGSGCVGQALLSMVRYLFVDSVLFPKVSGELMLMAVCLCNRMLYSGLDTTPFKQLYGKGVKVSHIKTLDARALVHIKDSRKLKPISWLVVLCNISEKGTFSYRMWNPKTRKVDESRNTPISRAPTVPPRLKCLYDKSATSYE